MYNPYFISNPIVGNTLLKTGIYPNQFSLERGIQSAGKQYFGNYDIPKQNPNQYLFDGVPHQWEVPEFYPMLKQIKLSAGQFAPNDESMKSIYESSVLGKVIGMKPYFLRSGLSDNLLYADEEEGGMTQDEAIIRDYNEFYDIGNKKAKTIDDIPESARNQLTAQRMMNLNSRTLGALQEFATESFNPSAKAEKEKWNYTPQFTQQTDSNKSNDTSIKITKDAYDSSKPLWNQEPNPEIPWGVNHPFRKKFIEEGATKYDAEDFAARIRFFDRKYGGYKDDYETE